MEIEARYIKDLRNYDPRKSSDRELVFDNALIHKFYNDAREGKSKWPIQLIVKKAIEIAEEMRKRGMRRHVSMKKYGRELDLLVSAVIGEDYTEVNSFREESEKRKRIKLSEVMEHFKKPIMLSDNFISLVGGLAVHEETQGDIDILVKWPPNTPSNILKPVEFRLGRALPKELSSRLSIMLDMYHGPFTSFIPLYDLVLIPKKPVYKIMMEGKVRPGVFITPLKGVKGYHTNEEYSIKNVEEFFDEEDYPLVVEKKYDGGRLQIHKDGSKIWVFTDGGKEVSRHFPSLKEKLKGFPEKIILDTETEGWIGKKHLGREEVNGHINQEENFDDSMFVFNVFDILYFYDEKWSKHDINPRVGDLTGEPLEIRQKYLDVLPFEQSTYEIPKPGLNRVVSVKVDSPEELRKAIKRMASAPASEGAMIKSLKSTYPLTGLTKYWVKFKNMADIHAVIVGRKETKTKGVWNYFIGLMPGSHPEWANIELNGKKYVFAGKTFSTNRDIPKGTIVTVNFHTLFRYDNGVRVYEPRIYEIRPDQKIPDTVDDALEIADEANLLAVKDKEAPNLPKEIRDIKLGKIVASDEKRKFVLQFHYRGRSRHGDLRIQMTNESLEGFTLFELVKGCIKEDVDSLEKAKKWDNKCTKLFKDHNKVQCVRKATESLEWLTVEGVVPPGEVGATKYEYGVFSIVDKGECVVTVAKPYFYEIWFYGEKLKGRYVVRKIARPEKPGEPLYLNFWKTKDQIPYVLTKRAVEEGWIPPKGVSALPPEFKRQVPNQFKYWLKDSESERRKIRDEYVKQVKLEKARFALHYRIFKGPKHIREGPSKAYWDLYINNIRFICDSNPLEGTATAIRDTSEAIDRQGKIKVGEKDNPYKSLEGWDIIIEKGDAFILQDNPMWFKARVGKIYIAAKREDLNSDIWVLKPVQSSAEGRMK